MSEVTRIKLYHYPATRSARVKWMLHEVLGDDFDVERVDLYGGEQYAEGFRAKNLSHAVPTLELTLSDGSTTHMTESGAMVSWLADAFPEADLAPPANSLSSERADFLRMLHFGSTTMDMMLWQIRCHRDVLPLEQRDPRTLQRYLNKFRSEVEPQLRARLTSQDFICGDRFCAADVLVGHSLLWSRAYQLSAGEECSQYAGRLMARPAFLKAFSDLGDFKHEVDPSSPLLQHFTG